MTSWLHEQRLEAARRIVVDSTARSVLDLGCGDGDLLVRLALEPRIERIVGVDLSRAALDRLRLRLEQMGTGCEAKVELMQASILETQPLYRGFDCVVLIETIEHIRPDRLSVLERIILQEARPALVVITTPNAEFNPLLGVPAHRFRHPEHCFEWNRARFRAWVQGAAQRCGYGLSCHDIGGFHPVLGGASQMAVLERQT